MTWNVAKDERKGRVYSPDTPQTADSSHVACPFEWSIVAHVGLVAGVAPRPPRGGRGDARLVYINTSQYLHWFGRDRGSHRLDNSRPHLTARHVESGSNQRPSPVWQLLKCYRACASSSILLLTTSPCPQMPSLSSREALSPVAPLLSVSNERTGRSVLPWLGRPSRTTCCVHKPDRGADTEPPWTEHKFGCRR